MSEDGIHKKHLRSIQLKVLLQALGHLYGKFLRRFLLIGILLLCKGRSNLQDHKKRGNNKEESLHIFKSL